MSIFHEKPTVSYRKLRNGQLVRLDTYASDRSGRLATFIACGTILFLGILGSAFLILTQLRGPGGVQP